MSLDIATVPIPGRTQDESPPVEEVFAEYPGATEDAPYGYKPDGTPYKRRPRGTGGASRGKAGKLPADGKLAESAAALLASANQLVGISLMAFGMTQTAASLAEANTQFELMARQALAADPGLCRKILSTGATGGKAGLVMAYSMLAVNMFPAAKSELAEKRAGRMAARDGGEDD